LSEQPALPLGIDDRVACKIHGETARLVDKLVWISGRGGADFLGELRRAVVRINEAVDVTPELESER
jgi:hypothetical protein